MERKFNTKIIAGLGVLTALVIVLQLFSNYVTFGPVSITMALIPVVVGACMYGPWGGLFLGVVQGVLVLTAPSTAGFFTLSPAGTIVACLLKGGMAGFIPGLVFMFLKNKHLRLGVILAAILSPICNTGIFTIFAFTVFFDMVKSLADNAGQNIVAFYLVAFIGVNFLIEFAVNTLLSPVVYSVYSIVTKKNK